MLNKEEKRLIKTYVIPNLSKIKEIYFHRDKIYGTDQMIKPDTNGKEGLWKAFADIYDLAEHIEKIIESLLREEYMKKESYDQKTKRRQRERNKEKIEEEKAFKKGQEMATKRREIMKTMNMGVESKKQQKAFKKAYQKGRKDGKEIEHLTDEAILRKAELIQLNKKILGGIKKDV